MTDPSRLDGPTSAPAAGAAPRSLVILLHGYGSNGADLIGLVPYWRAALPDTLFLAPNAPQACPGAPGGRQWWPLTSLSQEARELGQFIDMLDCPANLDRLPGQPPSGRTRRTSSQIGHQTVDSRHGHLRRMWGLMKQRLTHRSPGARPAADQASSRARLSKAILHAKFRAGQCEVASRCPRKSSRATATRALQ